MAIKSSDQITVYDVTDGHSVTLTMDSYTFPGSTTAAIASSVTTQVNAMRGAETVAASVNVSEIEKPTGITVTSDDDDTAPTLTIAIDASATSGGTIKIPVHIGELTFVKSFAFAIAFKGAQGEAGESVTVIDTDVTYAVSDTITQPTSWSGDMPTANPGQYLWTRTVVTYSDGNSTETYSYAKQGETGATGSSGTSVTVQSTAVTYGISDSPSTQPTEWDEDMPTASEGQYLWTKTVVTYSNGSSTETYSYAKQGEKGDKGDKGDKGETGSAGEDAIMIVITSSNGTIFKNTEIETVLTAHVYVGGVEVTGGELTALGTIKWYKDGGSSAVATGATLTIDAGDVDNKATYIAQLEG